MQQTIMGYLNRHKKLPSQQGDVNSFSNILLVQLGDIGDVVLVTPTLRAIKEACSSAKLSILVRRPFGALLRCDPHLFEIYQTERIKGSSIWRRVRAYADLARCLRASKYDLVIDVRAGDRGVILSFLTGAPLRVGRNGSEKPFWHALLLTHIIRDPPHGPARVHPGADQALRVVRCIGIDTQDSTPRLHICPAARDQAKLILADVGLSPNARWVTANPFSRWKYKEWNNNKWKETIERLWDQHRLPVVLIGSLDEMDGCSSIASAVSNGRAVNLAGRTKLDELAALISMASLHIGVDSAPSHIAAAVNTPTVTIHGPTDWRAWRTTGDLHKVVTPGSHKIRPPYDMSRSGYLDVLDPEPVLQAIDEVLQALN